MVRIDHIPRLPDERPPGCLDSGRRPIVTLSAPFALFLAILLLVAGCGAKQAGENGEDLSVIGGRIDLQVEAIPDTVMTAISRVLVQEGIALRRYDPDDGTAESGFIDLAFYREFDRELWDNTERLIKLRFRVERDPETGAPTTLTVEPLYNPHEVVTHEIDYTRLRLVPPGHPGFAIAIGLSRRIAAHAEQRAVTYP